MFAFSIWDKNKQRLVIARDRLGVKPVYYSINDNGIIFASEIKAILSTPDYKHPKANMEAISDYINEGYLTGSRTLFKNIKKLYPGSMLIIENSEIKEHCYWKLQPAPIASDLSEKDYIDKLRETLIDAIKIRLRSDVPIGFHLSGGLDSSSIVSISRKIFNMEPKTFSVRFTESSKYDENKFISIVRENSNTEHKQIMPDLQKDFPEKLRKMIYLLDEPADGPPVLSKFEINKFIKENGITVALTGQGADELFGGLLRGIYTLI